MRRSVADFRYKNEAGEGGGRLDPWSLRTDQRRRRPFPAASSKGRGCVSIRKTGAARGAAVPSRSPAQPAVRVVAWKLSPSLFIVQRNREEKRMEKGSFVLAFLPDFLKFLFYTPTYSWMF